MARDALQNVTCFQNYRKMVLWIVEYYLQEHSQGIYAFWFIKWKKRKIFNGYHLKACSQCHHATQ
jgi:hypothetical protein